VQAEVLILGAGPVGCTLALLLQSAGRTVAVCAPRERGPAAPQPRPIALSYASRLILERAGAWAGLAGTPIEAVHVSQRAGFGITRLTAADAGVPALGYVIDYRALVQALGAIVRSRDLAVDEPAAAAMREHAALLVHAEGSGHYAIDKSYGQTAVVGLVEAAPPARSTAYERFTAEGPLALLPLGAAYGMIWAMRPADAAALAASDATPFLEALQQAFGDRAGRFLAVHGRSTAPLALRVRARRASVREAYVGNSAQTLHPVAGQGLNLGLRDAWDLASCVAGAPDPGGSQILERYVALRRLDALATIGFTDLAAGAFIGTNPVARLARGAALSALDACAPAKRFFARRMIFGASAMP
jgi:2-octaprenyl-6-methoxyphenol hydroxylase